MNKIVPRLSKNVQEYLRQEGASMRKMTIEDLSVKGKRVLMRVDFNVPLNRGTVADDNRIRAALPSIKFVTANGGRLVLMSHLGRPKGQRVKEMSLKACVPVLSDLLGQTVRFVDDCVGTAVGNKVAELSDGEVLLLENLRFHKAETDNDPNFSAGLARLGDVYVNDAFGTAHRAHASTEGVTHHIHPCAAGYLMIKEIEYLGAAVENPTRPFVAILGGAKISGKIDVIANLLPKVDRILIGGGMSYTFFKAKGMAIGNSLLEEDRVEMARTLLAQGGERIVLPLDCLVSDAFDFKARRLGDLKEVAAEAIPDGWYGLDIGSGSVDHFRTLLDDARTVVWNGPMGVFEIEATAKGTLKVAETLAEITAKGATTIIGGGDSAAAVNQAGLSDRVSHVSTGGGASLEYLEGKILPGIAALTDKT
jgi:phosphoglycerate kinase